MGVHNICCTQHIQNSYKRNTSALYKNTCSLHTPIHPYTDTPIDINKITRKLNRIKEEKGTV